MCDLKMRNNDKGRGEGYKLLQCIKKISMYRQTDKTTDRQTNIVAYRGASLIKNEIS